MQEAVESVEAVPVVDEKSVSMRLKRAIGYRLRNQSDVARAIGISLPSINKIARGVTLDPSSSIIRRLANELQVSADYLLGLSDEFGGQEGQ